jgi:hypothetical protein
MDERMTLEEIVDYYKWCVTDLKWQIMYMVSLVTLVYMAGLIL